MNQDLPNSFFQRQEDWYGIQSSHLYHKGGREVLKQKASVYGLLKDAYPEFIWYPWLFKKLPSTFWNKEANQKRFYSWLLEELQIENESDLLTIRNSHLLEHGGSGLLKLHGNYVYKVLQKLFPEKEWYPWMFGRVPKKYWEDHSNRKKFFDWLAKELKIVKKEQWYELNTHEVVQRGGGGLLTLYNRSVASALESVYPDFLWNKQAAGRGYWAYVKNQRSYFDELAKRLNIQTHEEWYSVKPKQITQRTILSYYNGYYSSAIESVYPEFTWHLWKFCSYPDDYFNNMLNQRKFLDYVGEQLGVETLDDWYKFMLDDVKKVAGISLFVNCYQSSLVKALQMVYPEHEWLPWKFMRVPAGWWDDDHNLRHFMSWATKQLHFKTLDDWYNVHHSQLDNLGASTPVTSGGGIIEFLQRAYPHHPWDPAKFSETKSTAKAQLIER
jgi:hypothetical protein